MKTIGIENESRLNSSIHSTSSPETKCNATSRSDSISTWCKRIELKTRMYRPSIYTRCCWIPSWHDYARFVLYHEYLHALGNRFHDAAFRRLEQLWPHDGAERGRELHNFYVKGRQHGCGCTTCDKKYPRKRRANGRFRCRACSSILVDVMNTQEAN